MKHKILFFAFLSSFYVAAAQLVSYEYIETYTAVELTQIINDFGAGGVIIPAYDVDLYRVFYRMPYNDSTTVVTGALALPKNTDCKPALISYQHGTVSDKLGVPSYGSTELQICLVFASEGNVMVAPDYVGLGGSIINIHPYQHTETQAMATIELLRATRELQADLDFELSNQLFLFGYSQGGHATASAVKYIEEQFSDEFQVTAAMPMSGAYDLSGTQTDFIQNSSNYATPGYLPYIVLGFQSVYHDLFDSIQEIFKPPYDSLMPYYFYGHNFGIGFINGQCTPYPPDMFTEEAELAFNTDPNYPFKVRLQENDLLDWIPQSKIRMYYCTGDEQVYYRNSVVADSIWNLNGAPDAQAVFLTSENHGGCVDDALIAGRLLFGGLNNNGIEILLNYNQVNNSVSVSVLNDNISNYSIEWGDGSTGTSITNLQDNINYEVIVTSLDGNCSNSKRFTRQSITGINTFEEVSLVSIYPNPTTQYIMLNAQLEKNTNISIVDAMGKQVYSFSYPKGTEAMINVTSLSSGTYFVVLEGEKTAAVSFVKNK
jgi:dienelactone hydrolase